MAGRSTPPRVARWLLSRSLSAIDRPYALSDLDEEFGERLARDDARAARRWYRRQVWRSIVPAFARRLPRLKRPGTPASLREAHWSRSLAVDARLAARRLRSDLRVSVAILGMLALASGSAVASFSIMDSLVERQVPFPGGDRINLLRGGQHPSLIAAMRAHAAFDSVLALVGDPQSIGEAPESRRVSAYRVTPSLFEALAARPHLGRLLRAGDERPGQLPAVVLSHGLWQSAFGADPAIVGRTIRLSGSPSQVVGVTSATFRYLGELWLALDEAQPAESRSTTYHVRLARGVTREEGRALVTALQVDLGLRAADDTGFVPFGPLVYALDDHQRIAFRALGAGALLIFLAVCASVGSLLLAQVAGRRRECSTHMALGASPGRVFRQALFERGLLGALGIGLGVWVADRSLSYVRGILPLEFSTFNPIDLDGRALAVAAVLGVMVVLVAGVLPALTAARSARTGTLRQTTGPVGAGARATRVLLVAEVALACTLLLGASVLMRSFVEMTTAERGLNTRGLGAAAFLIPARSQVDRGDWLTYALEAREAILALPSVRDAVLSDMSLPGPGVPGAAAFRPEGADAMTLDLRVRSYAVAADFFDLHEIPILAGRPFETGDGPADVIISSMLASRLWGAGNPVGQYFRRGDTPYHVIGVAGEVTLPTIEVNRDGPEFYRQFTGMDFFSVTYRCDEVCPAPEAIEALMPELPPGLRLNDVTTLDDVYGAALEQPRKAAAMGLALSAAGLLTAAAGLFSVLTYAVSRRRREFGIRAAVGASPEQLRGLIVGEGLRVAAVGLAVGAAGAWGLGRAIAALQYGVTTADPVSWVVVIAGIGLMTLVASWRPASQAMRADPSRLLRNV